MSNHRRKRRIYLRPGVKTRLTYRQIIAATTGAFALIAVGSFFYFGTRSEDARAAVTGDYRTINSGNWTTASIWQTYNGSNWVTAASAPTSAHNVIEIQSGHTVTVSSNVNVDQVVIDAGGIVNINSNTMTVANGSGTDIQIDGTLNVTGTLTLNSNTRIDVNSAMNIRSGSTINRNTGSGIYVYGRAKREGGTVPTISGFWYIQNGGTYEHAMNGGALPLASWTSGSTIEITGITSTLPTQLAQTFQNFIWNCSSQNTEINFGAALSTVQGNFTLSNTGTSAIILDQQGNNSTLNVTGNFNVNGGTLYICVNGSANLTVGGDLVCTNGTLAINKSGGTNYGNSSAVITINNNLNVTGGTIDMTQCTANNPSKGAGFIYLKGNLNVVSPGQITATSSMSRGTLCFNGTTNQVTNDQPRIFNNVDVTVMSGATLQMDNRVFTSQADFTLASGGGLWIGSASGISATGASGNIQSTGTRSFSTGADYTYNGTAAQITGTGLPSQVRNLTLNNGSNCTLTNSSSVSGTLTLTNGLWIASDDTLTLGTSTSNLGVLNRVSGHVVGSFRRWINSVAASNVLFPVGTTSYYNAATFSWSSAPLAGGTITANFIATGYLGTAGLPLTDAGNTLINVGYAYWSLAPGNGYNGGTWTVNLMANGFPAIFDYTTLHVLRRATASSNWEVNGTHTPGTGSNSAPVANRTGMTQFGQYGITSGSANPLPIELTFFKARAVSNTVDLTWQTASEINNDYFTLERSRDGHEFTPIGTVPGAGNTTTKRDYKFTDYSPLNGTAFYRLRQTDYDGTTTTSEIKKVNIAADGMDHPITIENVKPNPFSNEFSADYYTDRNGDVSIEIIDMQGRVHYKGYQSSVEGKNEFSFTDGSRLDNGQYLLRISHSAGVAVSKIIKR